jgi:hypothetical protein
VAKKGQGSGAGVLATLATVFPEVIRHGPECCVVGRIIEEFSLGTGSQNARFYEPFEVVAQGRCRELDVRLDITSRCAPILALHHISQNGEANRMAKGTELLGMTF